MAAVPGASRGLRKGAWVLLALWGMFTSALLWGTGADGQAGGEAEQVIGQFIDTGGSTPDALARLCEEHPEQARAAFWRYLGEHETLHMTSYSPWRVLVGVHMLLGNREALALAKRMFVSAEDAESAKELMGFARTAVGALPWSWFYEVRLATKDEDTRRVKVVDRYLAGVRPASAEALASLQPATAKAFVLRAQGYRNLAGFLQREGQEDAARECRTRALEDARAALGLDAQSPAALCAAAAAEYGLGLYEAALQHVSEAIAYEPEFTDAYRLRSRVHRRMGDEERAAADAARVRELERAAKEAHLRSAEGLRDESRAGDTAIQQALVPAAEEGTPSRYLETALEHMENIIRYHPEQALFRLKRGMLYHEFGDVAEALADYDGFIAVVPDAAYVQYLRAKALEALGRGEEAAAALAAYQQGIAAFDPPQLPAELPVAERPRLGLDYAQVVELAKAPRENAETLARVLLDAGTDGPTWSKAIWALEELDDGQLIPLVPFLDQATLVCEMHYPGLLTLLSLLGRAEQASSIPYLLHAATDARPEAYSWRRRAVEVLGQLSRELAESALQCLVLASDDPKVVEAAAHELVQLSGQSYRDFCVRTILRAPREYQVRVAGNLKHETMALLVLLETMRDEDAEQGVRDEAAGVVRLRWPRLAELRTTQ